MMEMSDYALVQLASERLAHAREVASRRALVASVTPRESLRVRLGGALVEGARQRGYRSMIARVTAENDASLRLHERHGFVRVGHEREVAFKLGRWLDVLTLQRVL